MAQQKQKKVVAYKGLNRDWTCQGFQYEVGKTYKNDGDVKVCNSGFHSCEYPLDVFSYYFPGQSVFAEVEASGKVDRDGGDTKIASGTIKIKAEVAISDMVAAAIKWIASKCDPVKAKHSTGNRSASSSTGNWSASSSTGIAAVAMNIGIEGRAKAGKDGAIVLVNHDENGHIRHIRAAKVGEAGVKADTWYTLNDAGEFEEAV